MIVSVFIRVNALKNQNIFEAFINDKTSRVGGFFAEINCPITLGEPIIDDEKIKIGNKVLIASNVQVYTAYHPVLPEERLIENPEDNIFFKTCAAPVVIEDGVWIGGGAIILYVIARYFGIL